MSQPFSRTTRSLRTDGGRVAPALLIASLALLFLWVLWFTLSPLPLYETSSRARLEVQGKTHALSSLAAGRLVRHSLVLGRRVEEGEVLVELEAEGEQWVEQEEDARLVGWRGEIRALEEQIAAARAAELSQGQRDRSALAAAEAEARSDSLESLQAEDELKRAEQLFASRVIALVERDRALTNARVRRAAADASRLAISRLRHTQELEQSERRAERAELEQTLARLKSELGAGEARLGGSRLAEEQRQLRAPTSGRLGSVRDLAPGSVIAPGEVLATLIPENQLRAFAEFPDDAQGWIRPGQKVRLHLDGYPWTQYGWIEAEVSEVASEGEEGYFRATLHLLSHDPRISLRHGLPGSAEVEVGRTTPLGLLLRVLGRNRSGGSTESAS